MSPVGRAFRKDYMATCARWFRGDKAEMNRGLHHQASERQIERMVTAKLTVRIAEGETCVCEELPVILEPGDDPFFEETTRQWAKRVLTQKPAAAARAR